MVKLRGASVPDSDGTRRILTMGDMDDRFLFDERRPIDLSGLARFDILGGQSFSL